MRYAILLIHEVNSLKYSLIRNIGSICIHEMKNMRYLFG